MCSFAPQALVRVLLDGDPSGADVDSSPRIDAGQRVPLLVPLDTIVHLTPGQLAPAVLDVGSVEQLAEHVQVRPSLQSNLQDSLFCHASIWNSPRHYRKFAAACTRTRSRSQTTGPSRISTACAHGSVAGVELQAVPTMVGSGGEITSAPVRAVWLEDCPWLTMSPET